MGLALGEVGALCLGVVPRKGSVGVGLYDRDGVADVGWVVAGGVVAIGGIRHQRVLLRKPGLSPKRTS